MRKIVVSFLLAVFSSCFLFFVYTVYTDIQLSQSFNAPEKQSFVLSSEPIDVVIPCTEKDLPVLEKAILGIQENGKNIRRVIVISKEKYTDLAEWVPESDYPFSKKDLALAMFGDLEKAENYLSLKKNRAGWLLQQLLKLYAFEVIPNLSSNVLLLDADTVFLSEVSFMNERGGSAFHPSFREYHLPYFRHGRKLLPGFHRLHPEFSGISHHMLIQKSVVENLFRDVEKEHNKPFWQVFCALVDKKDIYHAGASEYELYFNYALAKTDQVSVETLKWTNTGDIHNLEDYKRAGYHYISAHDYLRESND